MDSSNHKEAVERIVAKFLASFGKVLKDDAAEQDFLSMFSPNIVWTDHAFLVRRVGHEAVLGLNRSFNFCNQPLEAKLKALHHTSTGVVVEQTWVGCCQNDIVRPDGQVAVKAHGKDFVCHVCMVMELHPETGISKIDEYYNKVWEDSVGEEKYQEMKGASMKKA